MIRRSRKIALLYVTGGLLFICFQNFSTVPLDKLKPQLNRAEARPSEPAADEMRDIRDLAPKVRLPSAARTHVAAPESGGDLNSVSQDWMIRQTRLLTDGADEKLVASINKRMNRMMNFEPVESDWPGGGAGDGKTDGKDGDDSDSGSSGTPGMPDLKDLLGMRPTSLQFKSVTQVDLGFSNRAKLSCSLRGDSIQWDLSRTVSERMDVNLRHEPTGNTNTLRLHYNW
jgi:hypothetical protein